MRSKVRQKKMGGCIGYAFFAIFAAAGTAFFYFLSLAPLLGLFHARSWIEVPCRVLTSEVAESSGDDGSTYRVAITYSYDFGGRSYTGDRYDFSIGSSSGYRRKAEVVERYPPGIETTCFADPEKPERSVVNRSPGLFLLWGLFPLPFMAVGYGGLLWMLFSQGLRRPRAGERTLGAQAARRDAVPAPGPQALRPQHTRTVKLVGTVVAALFWNGIVSVFLFAAVIPGFQRGEVNWFLTLFLVPFVLVGLGLIGAVFYTLLGLFNPVLHLELGDSHLTPGESCSAGWRFTGRADRIQELTIELEGRESATYRRGTDSVTDHHTFFSEKLFSTRHPATLARGSVTLRIPERTMPTFESANNKISWRLVFRGDIPNWPDVNEEFPVTVHPR